MLKKSGLKTISLLILLSICGACQQDSANPEPADSTYFPLQTGDYWIYQVTQENYSPTNPTITQTFQIQDKISSSYTKDGQLFFLMEESTRTSEQAAWQVSSIRSVYRSLTEAVSVDNNVPVVRLVFPIALTDSWNTNLYNANPDTLLHYQDNGRPFSVGSLTFDRTVSVVGANDSTLINLAKNRWVYAQNVGLIFRENASLAYCQSTPDCIGKAMIESGTTQKWELIASNRLP
ncbi:hypothetical protein WBJ53_12660 [Spirosoma sp. SC4-14]|uniref:hypothetical protein n=1 Tax=Spirosoma sp. SC4-14 TaxID=3128900 RepID=UPI0030D3C20B